jgi:hypothetical protein
VDSLESLGTTGFESAPYCSQTQSASTSHACGERRELQEGLDRLDIHLIVEKLEINHCVTFEIFKRNEIKYGLVS